MLSDELYAAFREDLKDSVKPYLWTDLEVWRYMDQAYRMFVRKIGGVHDFTSAATQVALSAGVNTSALDQNILKIEQAYLLSNNEEVILANWSDAKFFLTDDYGITRKIYMDNSAGPVRYMVIGNQRDIAKWVQVPLVNDTVQLQIYRLPIDHITDAGQEFTDVADDHHLYFLEWMKHLAFKKQDAETFNKGKSDDAGKAFTDYCAEAKGEWERYKHKTRIVGYGGI